MDPVQLFRLIRLASELWHSGVMATKISSVVLALLLVVVVFFFDAVMLLL